MLQGLHCSGYNAEMYGPNSDVQSFWGENTFKCWHVLGTNGPTCMYV
jgi:hypothetical protein